MIDSLKKLIERERDHQRQMGSVRVIDEFKKRGNLAKSNYLVFEGSPVFHTIDENSRPMCGTMTGSAYRTRIIDEPPEFLRPCGNCERIMRS